MNRRTFLGLFGCGVIGLATDWTGALKHVTEPLTGRGWAYHLLIPGADTAIRDGVQPMPLRYELRRIGHCEPYMGSMPLLSTALHPAMYFQWVAAPGDGLTFPEGGGLDLHVYDYADGTESPASDWRLAWQAADLASVTGCEYCGRAYFVWPAGGNCYGCGGRLPPPLINPSGRFMTVVSDGQRTIYSLERPIASDVETCDFCGSVLTADACRSCGASRDTRG